jgi:hypothetical protein
MKPSDGKRALHLVVDLLGPRCAKAYIQALLLEVLVAGQPMSNVYQASLTPQILQ